MRICLSAHVMYIPEDVKKNDMIFVVILCKEIFSVFFENETN